MRIGLFILMLLVSGSSSCLARDLNDVENVYTLYRDSPYIEEQEGLPVDNKFNYMRVHIATFDSHMHDKSYNEFMCNRVKGFFMEALHGLPNPEKHSNFWCEKGYYKD